MQETAAPARAAAPASDIADPEHAYEGEMSKILFSELNEARGQLQAK